MLQIELQELEANRYFNSLNVELKPICHLLELFGAHHILHVIW